MKRFFQATSPIRIVDHFKRRELFKRCHDKTLDFVEDLLDKSPTKKVFAQKLNNSETLEKATLKHVCLTVKSYFHCQPSTIVLNNVYVSRLQIRC